MTVPTFQNTAPEFVGVILAASVGARLFPLTSIQNPKHILPICGVPAIHRLLKCLEASGFEECVIAIAHDDTATIPVLKNEQGFQEVVAKPHFVLQTQQKMKITLLRLPEDCPGSVEALRHIETASVIPKTSHIAVFPGDLVLLETSAIKKLVDAHRQGLSTKATSTTTACTILLADVGEQDEHGHPLKESAKQKKGGLAREEEEIEFIALSYTHNETSPRVVWKQSKLDVEEDEHMTGNTPKLILPKPRLRQGITKVRTEWNDLHVYAFAPWVRRLILSRKSLLSLQGDLLPLLIARQFYGVVETFGSKADKDILEDVLSSNPDLGRLDSRELLEDSSGHAVQTDNTSSSSSSHEVPQYAVLAHIQKSALRAHSTAAYLHASKEMVGKAVLASNPNDPCLFLPKGTSARAKFHSAILPETDAGDKVTFKSSVVGRRCKLGNKCRLNNVVIMDDVTIGDNTILQNTIVSAGCSIGENCSLNDCLVAPGKSIPAQTKDKNETFIDAL